MPYKEKPIVAKDEKALSRLVSHVFTQRRKTLRNSLKGMLADDAFDKVGIDPMARPETLTRHNLWHCLIKWCRKYDHALQLCDW